MRSRIDLRRASTVPSVILFLSSLRKLKIKIKAGLKLTKQIFLLMALFPSVLLADIEQVLKGKSVRLESVSTSIDENKKLGDTYAGVGCKFNQPNSFRIQTDDTDAWYKVMIDREELKKRANGLFSDAGLDVTYKTASNPFANENPDIVITADISDLSLYACSAMFGGKARGNISMVVIWRVFDVEAEELIGQLETNATVESKKKIQGLVPWMVEEAFMTSSELFLAKYGEA